MLDIEKNIKTLHPENASLKQKLDNFEQRVRTSETTMDSDAHPQSSIHGIKHRSRGKYPQPNLYGSCL